MGTISRAKYSRPENPTETSSLIGEDGLINYTELNECLDTLRSGKAAGCDNVPVEAYRGSIEVKSDLFYLCRLMWHNVLDNVYSFEYLGSRLQRDGDDEADVCYRMVIAQAAFTSLSHLWMDHIAYLET